MPTRFYRVGQRYRGDLRSCCERIRRRGIWKSRIGWFLTGFVVIIPAFRGRRAFLRRIGGGRRGVVGSVGGGNLGCTCSIMRDYSRWRGPTFSMIPVSPQSYDTRFPCHQSDKEVVLLQWARQHEESRCGRGVAIWNAWFQPHTDQKISI
jgi:hypothetical protein